MMGCQAPDMTITDSIAPGPTSTTTTTATIMQTI
jgi:hypothetical protein